MTSYRFLNMAYVIFRLRI